MRRVMLRVGTGTVSPLIDGPEGDVRNSSPCSAATVSCHCSERKMNGSPDIRYSAYTPAWVKRRLPTTPSGACDDGTGGFPYRRGPCDERTRGRRFSHIHIDRVISDGRVEGSLDSSHTAVTVNTTPTTRMRSA